MNKASQNSRCKMNELKSMSNLENFRRKKRDFLNIDNFCRGTKAKMKPNF